MSSKLIVCLANSKKNEGRCIAGKLLHNDQFSTSINSKDIGQWVRPITIRKTQEISEIKGRNYLPLDVISMPLIEQRPEGHQIENFLINEQERWQVKKRLDWQEVVLFADSNVEKLWVDGTNKKKKDRISELEIKKVASSLYFLRIKNMRLVTIEANKTSGYINLRARFQLDGGIKYDLRVTDPWILAKILRHGLQEHMVKDAMVCISITGKPFKKFYYKVVASIITRKRSEG